MQLTFIPMQIYLLNPEFLSFAGDIIGALLNRIEGTISFTKNGADLGVAFSEVDDEVLYPTVSPHYCHTHTSSKSCGNLVFHLDLNLIELVKSRDYYYTQKQVSMRFRTKFSHFFGRNFELMK